MITEQISNPVLHITSLIPLSHCVKFGHVHHRFGAWGSVVVKVLRY